ncbi:hypothetical protein ACQPXH_19185 [Nocardia sp. CA-135953]|uniref:hypothetical protein n=1 Tax=Nocardia sp. CA-135953 TaxID=3239978 RepID=UPI003D95A8EC
MSEDNNTPTAEADQASTAPVDAPPADTPGDGVPQPTETVEELQAKLAKYKEIASTQEKRAKENAVKAKQFDELTTAQMSELERAQDEAKRFAAQAESFRSRAVVGEAKSLASEFANPAIAVKLLGDLTGYVDDQGEIDSARLKTDLDELLKREPYLARVQGPAGMRPNPAQGQSGNPPLTASQRAKESERTGDWAQAKAVKADMLLQMKSQTNH